MLKDMDTIRNRADLETAMVDFPRAILKRSVIRGLMRNSGNTDRQTHFLVDYQNADSVQVDGRVASAYIKRTLAEDEARRTK